MNIFTKWIFFSIDQRKPISWSIKQALFSSLYNKCIYSRLTLDKQVFREGLTNSVAQDRTMLSSLWPQRSILFLWGQSWSHLTSLPLASSSPSHPINHRYRNSAGSQNLKIWRNARFLDLFFKCYEILGSRAWWNILIILALGRLRQGDQELKASKRSCA